MTPNPHSLQESETPLLELGFDEEFAADARSLAAGDERLTIGRVVGQHRREWDVRDARGTGRAYLAGKRWARDPDETLAQPAIGDWVLLRAAVDGGLPVIEHILPRRTSLRRGAAGGRGDAQVVAANVDWIVIVSALTSEDAKDAVAQRALNPRRLERYLAAIESGGARSLFTLHKADLHPDAPRLAQELADRLARPVVCTSTKTSDGLDALRAVLEPRKTVGFIGMSGVGKSSIVNALLGEELQRVSREREADSRGRHTTTHRELFQIPGGALLIDTPGMREFSLAETEEVDLSSFDDIRTLAATCRFSDCGHVAEPGCAVRAALERGELLADRLAHYRTLRAQLDEARDRARGASRRRRR